MQLKPQDIWQQNFFVVALLDLQYMHFLPGLTLGTSQVGICLQLKNSGIGKQLLPYCLHFLCQSYGKTRLTAIMSVRVVITVFHISLPPQAKAKNCFFCSPKFVLPFSLSSLVFSPSFLCQKQPGLSPLSLELERQFPYYRKGALNSPCLLCFS